MSEVNYVQKLQEWVNKERAENGLIDLKFFSRLPGDPLISENDFAKAAYEILTGDRGVEVLDTSDL